MSNDLNFYIKEVLLTYGEVNLIGLGKLILKRSTASYAPDKGVILPPSISLEFSEAFDVSNQNLVDTIYAKNPTLSKDDIEGQVKDYVNNLFQQLIEKKTVNIDGLAVLNYENNQVVAAAEKDLDSWRYRGLPVLQLQPVQSTRSIEDGLIPTESTHIEKANASIYWLPFVLIGLLTIAALWYNGCNTKPRTIVPATTSVVDTTSNTVDTTLVNTTAEEKPMTETTAVDTTINHEPQTISSTEKKITEGPKTIEKERPAVMNKPANTTRQKGSCIAITGAFKNKANSEKHIQQIRKKGYEAYTDVTPSQLFRVGVYLPCEEAEQQLKQVQKDINSGAWLMK